MTGSRNLEVPRPNNRYFGITAILSSRLTFAATLLIFGGSVFALPISLRSSSIAGRFFAHFTLERRSTSCYFGNPEIVFICRSGSGYIFESNIRKLPELPQAWLSINRSSSTSGFWAITQITSTASVTLRAVEDAVLTETEPAQIRAAFLDHYVSTHPDFALLASHIRSADGALTTPIFGGYFHNAISLLSLIVLATCTAVQRPWRWLARRPKPGICFNCTYDLSATPQNCPCPECGTPQIIAPIAPSRANNAA